MANSALNYEIIYNTNNLDKINTHTEAEDLPVELFLGKQQSYPVTKKISEETTKEFLTIGAGERVTISNAFEDWVSLKKRGVEVKLIFPLTEDNKELLKKLKKKGIQVRNYNLQNLSFVISDNKVTHFAIKSDKIAQKRLSIKINHPDFTKAQKQFFNSI